MRKILLITIALTTLVLSGCTGGSDPVEVTKDFWKKVTEGQVESAMELISDEKMRTVLGKAYSSSEAQDDFKKNPVVQMDVVDKKVDGDQAEVKIALIQKNPSKTSALRFGLFKNDGKWKINKVFTQ